MDKKLFLLLCIIPVASTTLTWQVFKSTDIKQNNIIFPKKKTTNKAADTFFNQAEIINFSDDGYPKSKIIGTQIFHYPGDEDSEIIQPRITLFRANNSHVYINADFAWINQDGTRVILKGHTIVRREASVDNQFSQLETAELTLWPNRDFAETDKHVKITSNAVNATGIGMKAYLDKEHYYLLDAVKARHIPAKKDIVSNKTE